VESLSPHRVLAADEEQGGVRQEVERSPISRHDFGEPAQGGRAEHVKAER
jgi:hypothetical protein